MASRNPMLECTVLAIGTIWAGVLAPCTVMNMNARRLGRGAPHASPVPFITGIFTAAALLTATVAEAAEDCPAAPPPRIEKGAPGTVRIETDTTLEKLHEVGKNRHCGPIVGLYVGTLAYGPQIDDTVQQEAPVRYWARPNYVTPTLQPERVVQIPREFDNDRRWHLAAVLPAELVHRHAHYAALHASRAVDLSIGIVLLIVGAVAMMAFVDPE
jgi:hypothetical protein